MPKHPNFARTAIETYQYTACRGPVRHHWDLTAPPGESMRPPGFGTRVWWRCSECGMWKREIISRITGEVLSRNYDPPPGYKWEGPGKLTSAELRAQYFEEVYANHRELLEETGTPIDNVTPIDKDRAS